MVGKTIGKINLIGRRATDAKAAAAHLGPSQAGAGASPRGETGPARADSDSDSGSRGGSDSSREGERLRRLHQSLVRLRLPPCVPPSYHAL